MTFELWLNQQGYSESTIRVTARHALTARESFEADGAPGIHDMGYAHAALRRVLAWSAHEGFDGPFLDAVKALGLEPTQPRPAPATRPVVRDGYSPGDLTLLIDALRQYNSKEGEVLLRLAMRPGMRVGTLLALTYAVLSQWQRTMCAEHWVPWDRLWAAMGHRGRRKMDTVAMWLLEDKDASPLAGEAAYQRVNRLLRRLGPELGLEGPHNLERLRARGADRG